MTNLKEVLENIGYTKLKDYGRQYSARPLYRDSDNDSALTINKDTGEWFDFVERVGGPIEALIEKTLGRPLTPELKDQLGSAKFLSARREEIELPTTKIFDKNLLVNLYNDHSYWVNRGVSQHTISKFNGGLAVNGRMRNRYVFPISNDRDDLVGFSGRYLYPSQHVVRWKHLGQKSNWVYPLINAPEVYKTKSIILVESIGDMLALYDVGIRNAFVSFGVVLSSALIKFILMMDIDKVIISLNNDSHNKSVGNKAAVGFKTTLLNYLDEKQINIALPIKKDFGEMTRDEILLWKSQNEI
jgi:hypothetical protein